MAGGPIFPHSAYPANSPRTFPFLYVGGGANSKQEFGLGVAASIGSDSTWRLRFLMPPTIPSGTAKLRLWVLANDTSHTAKVTANCANVASGSSPSGATLTAETQGTVTWGVGDNDKYKELKITLANTVPAAANEYVMDLTFNATGWTLNTQSCWQPALIWE